MDFYFLIKDFRKSLKAPVDTMGCHVVNQSNEETKKFQILISLILSSQTKDQVVFEAMKNLNAHLKILTPSAILSSDPALVHSCIKKVGFHNKKLKILFDVSKNLINKKMPLKLDEILKLRGVGNKMAFLYLFHGCGINLGISVDTHVHRISNRLNLVKTKKPEETRNQLEKIFKKEEWPEINRVFVGFGQTVCLPVKPRCKNCVIGKKCPSYEF